jgi:hypothetical protein
MRMASLALLVLGVVPLALPGGSGASVANLCDRVCACTGCSDAEYEDCIDDGEDLGALGTCASDGLVEDDRSASSPSDDASASPGPGG